MVQAYNGTTHTAYHEIPAKTIKFKFNGTKLRLLAMATQNSSGATVNIDGKYCGNFLTYTSSKTAIGSYVFFEKLDLGKTEHNVVLSTNEKNLVAPDPYNSWFRFDAIDTDGELLTYTENQPIVSSGITLNKTTDNLQVGQTDNLVAAITPDNATNKNVKWTSSDTSVATIDSNGKVTALKAGTTNITATTTDGSNLSATCAVTVNQLASKIELNKTTDSLQVGQTDNLVATVAPDDATNKNVTWASSDTSVATVDSNGKVTAIKAGAANITATTTDGSNLSATCSVTVTDSSINKSNLTLHMANGDVLKYDLSEQELNDFLNWHDAKSKGTALSYYIFVIKSSDGSIKRQYVEYDKIIYFDIE